MRLFRPRIVGFPVVFEFKVGGRAACDGVEDYGGQKIDKHQHKHPIDCRGRAEVGRTTSLKCNGVPEREEIGVGL